MCVAEKLMLVYGLDGLGIRLSTIGNPPDWIDTNPTRRSFPQSFWTLKNFVVTNCVTTRYDLKSRHVVTYMLRHLLLVRLMMRRPVVIPFPPFQSLHLPFSRFCLPFQVITPRYSSLTRLMPKVIRQ